jgi:hypothetical protein
MDSCGGIYPMAVAEHAPGHVCFVCGGVVDSGIDLYVVEWLAVLHRRCLPAFLIMPEGAVVLAHGHAIILPELARVAVDVRVGVCTTN